MSSGPWRRGYKTICARCENDRLPYSAYCRECKNAIAREYLHDHPEQMAKRRARALAWYHSHKTDSKDKLKKWRAANREKYNAYQRDWYRRHKVLKANAGPVHKEHSE